MPPTTATAAGTVTLGDLTVNRLGFGAMRITGKGIWGPPPDPERAKAVLRRAIELGVNFIDTANSYGPDVSESLIAEALHPYPADLVIATKAGFERSGPDRWQRNGRPEHIRASCEGTLRRLRVDQIDVYQFHAPDPKVPYEESIGTFVELQKEGKVRHIGISNVSEEHVRIAQSLTEVVSIQNRYNVSDRNSESLLPVAERDSMAFLPWAPVQDAENNAAVQRAADRLDATVAQVVLAWLLARSSTMLPIPGTGSVEHLEENVAAAGLTLTLEEVAAMS